LILQSNKNEVQTKIPRPAGHGIKRQKNKMPSVL